MGGGHGMSKWTDTAITRLPKVEPVRDSWWIQSDVKSNRAAFQKKLVDDELARMNRNPRFGGTRKLHGDGFK
jgi:hypothetical protein